MRVPKNFTSDGERHGGEAPRSFAPRAVLGLAILSCAVTLAIVLAVAFTAGV